MKKTVWIFTFLSVFALLISFIQSGTEFKWWNFNSSFIEDFEVFTVFILNPVSLIVCFILSIKLMIKEKTPLYLITLFIPIISIGLTIFLFFYRVINVIFF